MLSLVPAAGSSGSAVVKCLVLYGVSQGFLNGCCCRHKRHCVNLNLLHEFIKYDSLLVTMPHHSKNPVLLANKFAWLQYSNDIAIPRTS